MRIFGPLFLVAFILQGASAQTTPPAAPSAQSAPAASSSPKLAAPAAPASASSAQAASASPQVTAINVKAYGIFSAVARTSAKAGTGAPASTRVANVRLLKKTLSIPMHKGVNFGFQYEAVGTPRGERATLHFVVIYPQPGLRKPGSSTPLARDEYDEKVRIGLKGGFDGYELDNDWELVPGDWTLEILSGTKALASETFTLVK